MNPPRGSRMAAQVREQSDPAERFRPLPWFVVMLIGAMAMWGMFYIHDMKGELNSAYGDSRTPSALMASAGAAAGATPSSAAVDGGQLFAAKCAACHQATGLGLPGVFPPLAGSEWVLGSDKVLVQIPLHGITGSVQVKGATYSGAMPVFNTLSDAEIAAVLTYVRSQWGNAAPTVSPATVAAGRKATQSRSTPFASGDEITQAAAQ
jgi:mono/diheme cytochrome c family protein